nr:hypothetical protein [Tanacetum cinerariifolium]
MKEAKEIPGGAKSSAKNSTGRHGMKIDDTLAKSPNVLYTEIIIQKGIIDIRVMVPLGHDICSNGVMSKFLVKYAWDEFKPRGTEVPWYRIVWFTHQIPRHAFHLWLVMRNSLKTQDKLRQWDVGDGTDLLSDRLEDIMSYLQHMAHKRTATSIIGRLLLAASAYYIWIERNNRLLRQLKRSLEVLRDIIMVTCDVFSYCYGSGRLISCVWKLCKANIDVH